MLGDYRFYIVLYIAIINLYGLILTWSDKKKSKKNKWRVPESKIFAIALLGGAVGVYIGMTVFRHKTRHIKFTVGIPAIIILQGAAIGFVIASKGKSLFWR